MRVVAGAGRSGDVDGVPAADAGVDPSGGTGDGKGVGASCVVGGPIVGTVAGLVATGPPDG